MKYTPDISIIIPALNEEVCLPKLLNDLKNQTFNNFEVILVDGRSEDKTLEKAKRFEKNFPLAIISSQKRNVCFQRNLGTKYANADWIIFMDADIRIEPYFLQGIKYRIDQNEADIFATYLKPDSSHQLDVAIMNAVNLYINAQKTSKKPTAMESMFVIKKNIFQKLGGFDESIKWGEGTVLLSKAVKKGYILSIYKDPEYTFSLRRLRSQGKLKLARSLAQLFIAQQFNTRPLSDKKISKIYPMQGGNYFNKKPPKTTIEQIFKDMTELSPKQFMNKFFPIKKSPLIKKISKKNQNLLNQ